VYIKGLTIESVKNINEIDEFM
jgi:hypothetical protein